MKYLWLFVCLAVVRGQAANSSDELPEVCRNLGGPEEFFQCDKDIGIRCFNRLSICDGRKDCKDNWDEANCECRSKKDCKKGYKCQKDKFAATSKCVRCAPGQRFVKDQCEDIDECRLKIDVCEGKGACINRPSGYECVSCPQGYEASLRDLRLFTSSPVYNDTETFRKLLLCTDHNECKEGNPCGEAPCFNRIGGHSCECPPNHERQSEIRENICQAIGEQPVMAIGNESSIVIFDLRSAVQTQELKWSERIIDLSGDNGMVVFATRRQVWEYRIATASTLIMADFENEEDFSNGDIKKISVDWENHRVYVLTGDSVSVVDFVGRAVKIIEHRGNISSIAVDPLAGYLFYSEFGHVRRTYLDGFVESTKAIFTALPSEDLVDIEVLAVDPNLKYVYYIHNRVLYSFDYDGHRAMVISGQADFTRLEPFEDLLYATYRVVVSDSIVTLGRTGYSVGDLPGARVESFKGTLPKSFAIIQRAKFPTRPKENNSCLKEPCSSEWCFPMPTSRTPSFHCGCGTEMRGNCLPLKTYRLRPEEDILPNEVNVSVAGAAVPVTAQTTRCGIIIPIVLVLFYSIAYFR